MTMVLTRIETIQILKYKLVAMIKNFKPKIRKWLKGITKAIFKYKMKKLTIAKRKIDATGKKKKWMQSCSGISNLAVIRIFEMVKHWPTTFMKGIYSNKSREKNQPMMMWIVENKATLNIRYIRSVNKFYQ